MNTKVKQELVKLDPIKDSSIDGFEDFFKQPRLSKPEMHLLLKPFFVMDRHADRFQPIEYVYSVIDNGKAVTRGWCVQPHFKYGLPGPFDRDVTTVIYEIVNEHYFAKGVPVPELMPIGTLRSFAERMGLTGAGPVLAAIKESLKRLMNTLASCEETFFDNKKHRYVSLSFRLLAAVGFDGEDDGAGGKHEENFVIFDQHILTNLNTGYVMVVDVDCLRSLSSNIAKQLYSHLAYRFFVEAKEGDTCWVADYDWLSIHLGIKKQEELWRAKQQLQGAHEELLELGYISDFRWDGWRIIYRPGLIWQGEQLRRKSGKARHRATKSIKMAKPKELTSVPREPHDSLIPALAAFASGLSVGEERIKALGLTIDQANILCLEKGILIPPK
jgi:hypothetical protein